jgi:hypothetical protein
MSYEGKKHREKQHLAKVKLLYAAFPRGVVIECEEPDFLVTNEEINCGIELVEYVRGQGKGGSPIRWREELHEQTIVLAKSKHEAQSAIAVSVHVHWFHHRELRSGDVDRIADEICKIVNSCQPLELNEGVAIEPDYRTDISDYVSRVSIRRRSSGKTIWSNVEVGPAQADAVELQRIISSKNEKVNSYLTKCSEVWLVIVADGKRISSSGELSLRERQTKFESEFKKVLYYDAETESVTELLT